jgi:biofilm protein TabA
MIYDTLTNSHLYYGISARLQKALDFLVNSDFSTIPDGRYEIDGNDVFANISHGMTVQNTPNAEAHNTYLDIQYLIEGHELIGVAQRETLTEVEAHPERDIWFYTGKYEYLSLGDNRFIILWPHDAHAPNHAVDGIPVATRKCVVKVRVYSSAPSKCLTELFEN